MMIWVSSGIAFRSSIQLQRQFRWPKILQNTIGQWCVSLMLNWLLLDFQRLQGQTPRSVLERGKRWRSVESRRPRPSCESLWTVAREPPSGRVISVCLNYVCSELRSFQCSLVCGLVCVRGVPLKPLFVHSWQWHAVTIGPASIFWRPIVSACGAPKTTKTMASW